MNAAPWVVLVALFAPAAGAQTVNISLASVHVPQRAYHHNFNPGVFYESKDGLTVGVYGNTLGRASFLLGWAARSGPWGLTVGAVSGYQRREFLGACDNGNTGTPGNPCYRGYSSGALSPMLAGSYTFREVGGVSPRVSIVPGFSGSSTCVNVGLSKRLQD